MCPKILKFVRPNKCYILGVEEPHKSWSDNHMRCVESEYSPSINLELISLRSSKPKFAFHLESLIKMV